MFGFDDIAKACKQNDELWKILKSSGTDHHNYKCPVCGGEFDHWDYPIATYTSAISKSHCPFCLTEKGNFPKSKK